MTDAETATDDELPTVQEAWSRVMNDVQFLGKDRRTDSGPRYNFRGVDDVLNAFGPILRKHRVIVLPLGGPVTCRDVTVGTDNKPAREVIFEGRYLIIGPRGDSLPEGGMPGEAIDVGDKAVPKAGSVSYREFMFKSTCLSVEGYEGATPDPDLQNYQRGDNQRESELSPEQKARSVVRGLLDAGTIDGEYGVASAEDYIAEHQLADVNVTAWLGPQTRTRLNIPDDDKLVMTLSPFTALVRLFVEENHRSVKAPTPMADQADAAQAEHERAEAEQTASS